MTATQTIRNCLPMFRVVCPKSWDALAATDDPAVRHCGRCDRAVHYCTTDAETIAHARAGNCIAREMPDVSGMRYVTIGTPSRPPPPPPTPEVIAERSWLRRERGIDDAIENAQRATRACPECAYPAPDWRVACRVCGFAFGRVSRTGQIG